MPTRFGHTNLIARDWRQVAAFYRTCFGCVDVPPERHYSGAEGNLVELQARSDA